MDPATRFDRPTMSATLADFGAAPRGAGARGGGMSSDALRERDRCRFT